MSIIDQLKSMDHALTVKELAAMLHLGKTAIYEMVRRGAIPCIRFGYTVHFDPQEIASWLAPHYSN
jgi:excisionase family DNA binding protein